MALPIFHISKNGIYHRDLKPANFLVKENDQGYINLYLNDFGISKIINEKFPHISISVTSNSGTMLYNSPERIENQEKNW